MDLHALLLTGSFSLVTSIGQTWVPEGRAQTFIFLSSPDLDQWQRQSRCPGDTGAYSIVRPSRQLDAFAREGGKVASH